MFVSSVRILSILTSFIYINGVITIRKLYYDMVLGNMGLYNNGKREGWKYNNKSLKIRIENNEFVKNIRNKLMKERIKRRVKK